MDLSWTEAQRAMRHELRRWLEQNLAEWRDEIGVEFSGDTREGFAQQLLWGEAPVRGGMVGGVVAPRLRRA